MCTREVGACVNVQILVCPRPCVQARVAGVSICPPGCVRRMCVLVAELVRVHIGVPAQVVWFGVNELGEWGGGDGMALIYPFTECLLCAKECAECFI